MSTKLAKPAVAGEMTSFDPAAVVPPAFSAEDCMALEQRHGAQHAEALPLVIARARGAWVQDGQGKRYIDMASSCSGLTLGHRHRAIIAALKAQADRIALSAGGFSDDQHGPFLAELCAVSGYAQARSMQSDADALAAAVRVAKAWGVRVRGLAPKAASVLCASGVAPGAEAMAPGDVAAIEAAIGPNTAAVIISAVETDGPRVGSVLDGLARLRATTTAEGVLLILDERGCGLGRTGKMFAYEHAGIRPDAVILGGALGGGIFPVSALLADAAVLEGTSGPDCGPIGAAVALAALGVIAEEGLCARAVSLGALLTDQLNALDTPQITAVRGIGLLIGIELAAGCSARSVSEALMAAGVLVKATSEQVIRIAPPLTIEPSDLEWAVARVAEVLG